MEVKHKKAICSCISHLEHSTNKKKNQTTRHTMHERLEKRDKETTKQTLKIRHLCVMHSSPYLSKSIQRSANIDGTHSCSSQVALKSKSKCEFTIACSSALAFSITNPKLENLKETLNLLLLSQSQTSNLKTSKTKP